MTTIQVAYKTQKKKEVFQMLCKRLEILSSNKWKTLTNFKQENDMPNFILESFSWKQFGIWIVRERDGKLSEWLASITAIYVMNDWRLNKPIEIDVERYSKFEIYVEVWTMRSIEHWI